MAIIVEQAIQKNTSFSNHIHFQKPVTSVFALNRASFTAKNHKIKFYFKIKDIKLLKTLQPKLFILIILLDKSQ